MSAGCVEFSFTQLEAGELCMLLVYPKATRDNIPGHILKAIRKEIEDEHP